MGGVLEYAPFILNILYITHSFRIPLTESGIIMQIRSTILDCSSLRLSLCITCLGYITTDGIGGGNRSSVHYSETISGRMAAVGASPSAGGARAPIADIL